MRKLWNEYKISYLSPLTLKFKTTRLENLFLSHIIKTSIVQQRVSIILGIFLYSLFALLDVYFAPDYVVDFLIVRFCIVVPLGFLVFYLTFKESFHKYAQLVMSIVMTIACLGVVYMISKSNDLITIPYFTGLVFAIFFTYNFVRLTFKWATLITIFSSGVFELAILFNSDIPKDMFIAGHIYLVIGILLSALSAYYNEALARKEFYYKVNLITEHESIQQEKLDLEEVVSKRTRELLKANKALTKAKLKAEGSERLKTSFLAIISHEVRTPLTKVIGFSELLTKSNITDEKKKKYKNLVEEGANQLLKVLNDIVDMSKIETQDIPVSNSSFLLNNVVNELEMFFVKECERLGKKDMLKIEVSPILKKEFVIKTDRQKVKRVLENLIQNAIKFTPEGNISINVTLRDDNYYEFCVSDTGKGVKPEDQEIIFDIFRKVDERAAQNYGGTGLGLTLSKGIVRHLGGKIWLQSEIGKGSSFFFTVPYIEV